MEAEGRMVGLDLGWVVRPWRWQASHLLSTCLLLLAAHTRGPQVDKPLPGHSLLDAQECEERGEAHRVWGQGGQGDQGDQGGRLYSRHSPMLFIGRQTSRLVACQATRLGSHYCALGKEVCT